MIDSRTLAKSFLELATLHGEEQAHTLFLEFLEQKNLMGLLPHILDHLKHYAKEEAQEDILHIRSRYELSSKELKLIKQLLNADASAKLVIEQDDSVIGGFSASYRGYVYNGSLETTLMKFNHALTH